MKLSTVQLSELEALAIEAAQRAASMIQSRVEQDVRILKKDGGSSVASQVVTEVDLESQRLILDSLDDSLQRYELGLLTEESPDDSSRHEHDHFWCIDPMDGTLAFTKGSPGYSVSIALVARDGTPQIGVICDPSSGTLYHAVRGQGARKNHQAWPPPSAAAGDALSLFIDNSFVSQAGQSAFRDRLEALAAKQDCSGFEIIGHQGAVLNACSVASRTNALYFKPPKPEPGGGSLWDFAATACLYGELGLPVSDFHGQPLHLNPDGDTFMNHKGVLYASTAELASAAAGLLA